MSRPTVLELFAGIGGMSLGLERAGFDVVGQVEIDPFCRSVLARHWPGVPQHDDVRTCIEWWRSETRPTVDVVAGGFPCQPVSNPGRKMAQQDPRWLWPAMVDVIDDIRPTWVIGENVPGLRTRGLATVHRDLQRRGYRVATGTISACEMGAPHPRERLFILAHTDGQGCRPGRTVVGQAHRVDGPRPHGPGPRGRDRWPAEPDVGRVVARPSSWLDGDLNAHAECIKKGRPAGIPVTDRLRALREYLGSPEASSGPERCALCGHPLSAVPCRGACSPWHVGERPAGSEDVRCMREGILGLLAHASEDLFARVSVRDGSPQCTQTLGSAKDRRRALGNAVVPQVAEHIGRMILNHLAVPA